MSEVNEFKDLLLTYSAPAGATVLFYTDMPGRVLAQRKSANLAATTADREQQRIPLDTIEGRLYKIKVTSGGVVRLFEGVLRHRPIGEYFDGANGEFWETTELSLV
jgi:hypothetical protein